MAASYIACNSAVVPSTTIGFSCFSCGFISIFMCTPLCRFRLLQVNVGTLKYPEYEVNVTQSLFQTQESFQKSVCMHILFL